MAIIFISSGTGRPTATISSTAGANALIVAMQFQLPSAPPTVSDTVGGAATGNVWVVDRVFAPDATEPDRKIAFYRCDNPAVVGATHVFTSSQSNAAIGVLAVNKGSSALLAITSFNSAVNTAAAGVNTGTVAPAATGALLISACHITNNNYAGSIVESGWTEFGYVDPAYQPGGQSRYKIKTDTTPESATWIAANGDPEIVAIAAYELAAGDAEAPTLSSPTGTATGTTTATVGGTTNEANGTMYVVVTTSATQPSVAQIKAGLDQAGAEAAFDATQAITTTGAKTFNATGLTASTTYYAHLVHTDAAANDSNRVSSASFTTSAADTTAPVLSSPTGSATGSTAATVGATTNEANGTLYVFVSTSATPPGRSTFIAGTGAAYASSQSITTTGAKTFNAIGLTASTLYYAHLLHIDAAGNDSNIVSPSFTTSAPLITGPSGAAGASTSAKSQAENITAVHTFTANEAVSWDLNGGADVARFLINSSTGALAFLTAPNFESPTDADTNNTYVVGVRATDTSSNASTQTVTVTVTNANEAPTFVGPNIANQTGTEGVALTPLNTASLFADADASDTATYSAVSTFPPGVTVSTAGVISGTPTTAGTYSALAVRRIDAGGLSVDSNTFTFTIGAGTLAGFDFNTAAGCVFGAIVGSLTGIARQTGVNVVVRAYNAATGTLVATSGPLTTNGTTGRLPRWEDAAITAAAPYHLVFVRASDGAIACRTLVAT